MTTILEQVASGALAQAAGDAIASGAVLDLALLKGQALASSTQDPAAKAAFGAVLKVLATDDARETLTQVASHELIAFTTHLGLKQKDQARALFLADPATTFAQRHALLASDDQATRQRAQDHAFMVARLESLALDVLSKGGAAALPFLLAIF